MDGGITPSAELLNRRKDCIIHYWELQHDRLSERFLRETETLMPIPEHDWQNPLFKQLSHAIEVTALQRGAKRWHL